MRWAEIPGSQSRVMLAAKGFARGLGSHSNPFAYLSPPVHSGMHAPFREHCRTFRAAFGAGDSVLQPARAGASEQCLAADSQELIH
jgi:hypothetical protein